MNERTKPPNHSSKSCPALRNRSRSYSLTPSSRLPFTWMWTCRTSTHAKRRARSSCKQSLLHGPWPLLTFFIGTQSRQEATESILHVSSSPSAALQKFSQSSADGKAFKRASSSTQMGQWRMTYPGVYEGGAREAVNGALDAIVWFSSEYDHEGYGSREVERSTV